MNMDVLQISNKAVFLNSRPSSKPGLDNFRLKELKLRPIHTQEILVKNLILSVDPYMRIRMIDAKSYLPPFKIDQVLDGGCIGQVIASKNDKFKINDYVISMNGWREYYISNGYDLNLIQPKNNLPIQYYLSAMGMPGLTAYAGLLKIGEPKPGDVVLVSAAAGAVGHLACQIAKMHGCHVIASVGCDDKARWLQKNNCVDFIINYRKTNNFNKELQQILAVNHLNGIDIYFDNVGSEQLEAAIDNMNEHGRIVACGMISHYNNTSEATGPKNIMELISKRLKIQGFIVSDYNYLKEEFEQQMAIWLETKKIVVTETIKTGISSAIPALIGLFDGNNVGKMLIAL